MSDRMRLLNTLILKAAPYMGRTWRAGVEDQFFQLQTQFDDLSAQLNAALENALTAEDSQRSLRDRIATLQAEIIVMSSCEPVVVDIAKETVIEVVETKEDGVVYEQDQPVA